LAIQFVVGGILFAVIGAVAAVLHVFVGWGETHNAFPPLVGYGMTALEFLLWSADVVCFTLFVASEVWRFWLAIRETWRR
jgi:hypothetical protein